MSDMFDDDELSDFHNTSMTGRDFFHRMVLAKQKQTTNTVNYAKIYDLFMETIATQTPFAFTKMEAKRLASQLISIVVDETRKS